MQEEKQLFVAAASEVRGHIAELRPLVRSTGDQPLLDEIERKTNQWLQLYEQYMSRVWDRDFDSAPEIMLDQIYPLVETLNKLIAPLAESGKR